MVGLCLVLLLGGAPASAPAKAAPEVPELRLHHAVVITEDALDGAGAADDLEPAGDDPEAVADAVPLRKASVLRAPDPIKEP